MTTILLNPGPVTLTKRVREAMLKPDLCHRESEFSILQGDIREKLLRVYELDKSAWVAALLTGSGTAAVEAMISTLIPDDGKLLSVENGVYGERITKIAEQYGIPLAVANFDWTEAIDTTQLERQLTQDQTITHLAVIHHETTTGRLNELLPILDVCKAHNVKVLLDGVSSFGAEAIPFQHESLLSCAATANKCLHGVPGTAFVILRRDALNQAAQRNLYLNLKAYVEAQDNHGTPFTQSVQTFYALDEALDELFEAGGQQARLALYLQRMSTMRAALEALKIEPLLAQQECSAVLHAYKLPAGCEYSRLHRELKASGFIIYAGQAEFAKTLFRISMMGDIKEDDMLRLIAAFQAAFS
jgi:2-aminoethylphosphonate-pyruvate transaminase